MWRASSREYPREKTDAGLLERVPECFGGIEVLRDVEEKVRTPAARVAVRELLKVFRILELYGLAERVIFDFCDFKDFDYYTGVMFEGFVEGSGYPVCGGGRYDKLLGLYGDDALGTGFAVDLNQMLPLVTRGAENRNGTDFLVIDLTREKRSGIVLSRKLRARGWRVARDIIRRDLAGSLGVRAGDGRVEMPRHRARRKASRPRQAPGSGRGRSGRISDRGDSRPCGRKGR